MKIALYNRENIANLSWPQDVNGKYAARLLPAFIQQGTRHWIDNVDNQMQALLVNDQVLPIVLGNPQVSIKNSYVGSLLSHYIDYAIEEFDIELQEKPWLKALGVPMLEGLGTLFKKLDFDRVVFVNNWLLSTNLYPDLNVNEIEAIRDFLIRHYPEHAIVFRSINDRLNRSLLKPLENLGFTKVMSRQVYILNPATGHYRKKDSYRKDRRLERRTEYRWFPPAPDDIPRIKALYDDLYLDKYSRLNPQFNERFHQAAIENRWLTYHVLKKDGQMDAVVGYFERDGVMTAPVVGYDRSLPPETGLFRLLSLKLLDTAIENHWILHQSSGVSKFKMHRGGEPALEYNLVYYQHLPPFRRLPWQILSALSEDMMVPLMQRYSL